MKFLLLYWLVNWKSQFSFQSLRKAIPKNAQTTAQLHSSHTLAKKKERGKEGKKGRKKESEVAQLCPTFCNLMDCSPPGSSVHGIFQQEY